MFICFILSYCRCILMAIRQWPQYGEDDWRTSPDWRNWI